MAFCGVSCVCVVVALGGITGDSRRWEGSGSGGGSFTYDTFLTDSTTSAGCIVYGDLMTGYVDGQATIVIPSTMAEMADGALAGNESFLAIFYGVHPLLSILSMRVRSSLVRRGFFFSIPYPMVIHFDYPHSLVLVVHRKSGWTESWYNTQKHTDTKEM